MALEIAIPGRGTIVLRHAVFDVNGTLATDGVLIEGVAERLQALKDHLEIHLLTADTHGGQAEIDHLLGLTAQRVRPGREREQKALYVSGLGAENVVAIGNGANDVGMLEIAAIGIAVLGTEGLNGEALRTADVVVTSIHDALDLLLKPKRLSATLRR